MLINARLPLPRKVLLRLRSILLVVMLTVLALPLGGLYFFSAFTKMNWCNKPSWN